MCCSARSCLLNPSMCFSAPLMQVGAPRSSSQFSFVQKSRLTQNRDTGKDTARWNVGVYSPGGWGW